MAAGRQTRFYPANPDKYIGDPLAIFSRSSWELLYMRALDASPLVAKWVSEPKFLNIKYQSPVDKKIKTYWPDFLILYTSGEKEIIEIKPLKETLAERAVSMYDKLMLANNIMKWRAAQIIAKQVGAKFRVVTEAHLFVNQNKTTRKSTTSKPSRKTVRPRGTTGTVKPQGTRK